MKLITKIASLSIAAALSASAYAGADVDAGKATLKQNNCLKCHGMEKDKDAPSFKKLSAKWKGKADASAKLKTHLTTGPKVKLEDGSEEEHKKIKVKDDAELANVIAFILEQ